MSRDWEQRSGSNIEDVEDSSLVEYMMGRDIHINIGNGKSEGKRKIMVTDYQVSRRGQVQAVVKLIQTAGEDLGEEYKMQVSGGRHSIRGAIEGKLSGGTHARAVGSRGGHESGKPARQTATM